MRKEKNARYQDSHSRHIEAGNRVGSRFGQRGGSGRVALNVDGLAGKNDVINLNLLLRVEEKVMLESVGLEEAMMGN